MIEKIHALLQALRLVFQVARLTAVSLVVSLLAVAALLLTSQSLEALRVIAEGFGDAQAQLISTETGAVLISLMLWYSARVILYAVANDAPNDTRPARRLAARYLPRLYGALPLAALSYASFLAGRVQDEIGSGSGTRLWILTGVNAALLVGFLVLVSVRRTVIDQRAETDGVRITAPPPAPGKVAELELITRQVFGLMLALWATLFLAVLVTDGSFAEHAGVLATTLTCMATWVPAATALQYVGARWDFPVLRGLALYAALLALVDSNENHYVQHAEPAQRPRSFDRHVAAWLATRPDRSATSIYPVFIVAADGGGIRNTYLTASVLGALEDSCPLFGEHLLAISAVSGGAIGAAVHRAMLADYPPDSASRLRCALPHPAASQMGARQARADSVIAHDMLSPVIAAGLYLEAAQKFIPWGIGRFDRARALEHSAERSYSAYAPSGSAGLRRPFHALADSTLPLLYLNTTSVEEGKRMVIAGAEPDSSAFHPSTLFDLDSTLSIRLSTAAVMSARFPFVTPEAVVSRTGGDRRFVDGGYFDNSGATTALDIASALKRGPFGNKVRPIIVHIGISDATITRESNTNAQRLHVALNEIMAPVRALFAIRDSRGAVVVKELAEQALVDSNHVELIDITTGERNVPFVLGWLMSKNARVAMRKGIDPGEQSGDSIRTRYERIRTLLEAK